MKPWSSSSLAWFSLLTACLFGYDGTFALFGSNVAELCEKLKTDTHFLAMGIITDASGESRFYVFSTEFEGLTVPADRLTIPPESGSGDHPTINLNDAEALDLSSANASWPEGPGYEGRPTNGKNAFLLAFKPEAGFHSGEKFLAIFFKNYNHLSLASLTNLGGPMKKVYYNGNWPPGDIVFSTDNKVATPGDASIIAAMRYVTEKETTIYDVDVTRAEGDTIYIKRHPYEHPSPLKPSLAIDGGFLLNGDQPKTPHLRLFAMSNAHRKIYVFYGEEEKAVEVTFNDFLICPNGWLPRALKGAGIAVPVIVVIGAVAFFMAAKKKKQNSAATSAVSGNQSTVSGNSGRYATSVNSTAGSTGFAASVNSTAASTAGMSTFTAASGKPSMMALSQASSTGPAAASSLGKFKTRTSVKPRTPNKKPRTANKKPRTPNQGSSISPGMLARSMESSPSQKPGVFKFKAAK